MYFKKTANSNSDEHNEKNDEHIEVDIKNQKTHTDIKEEERSQKMMVHMKKIR